MLVIYTWISFDKCVHLCNPFKYRTFPLPQNVFLCSFVAHTLRHKKWFDFYHYGLVLLVLKLHINGIVWYLFSYLSSFTQGKVSKIYPCFSLISNLFLFIANSNIVWIYHRVLFCCWTSGLLPVFVLGVKATVMFLYKAFYGLVLIPLEKHSVDLWDHKCRSRWLLCASGWVTGRRLQECSWRVPAGSA